MIMSTPRHGRSPLGIDKGFGDVALRAKRHPRPFHSSGPYFLRDKFISIHDDERGSQIDIFGEPHREFWEIFASQRNSVYKRSIRGKFKVKTKTINAPETCMAINLMDTIFTNLQTTVSSTPGW